MTSHYTADNCAECREVTRQRHREQQTTRFTRWVMLILMGIVSVGLILGGKHFADNDTVSNETGELLVYGGIALGCVLIVLCVLIFAADD